MKKCHNTVVLKDEFVPEFFFVCYCLSVMSCHQIPLLAQNGKKTSSAQDVDYIAEDMVDVFKRNVKDYSKTVRFAPEIYLTSTGSLIFQNKKKAAIEYYYYNIQQKEKYNKLVEALSEAFFVAATADGMSDEDRMKIFSSCYPSIEKENILIISLNRFFSNYKVIKPIMNHAFIDSMTDPPSSSKWEENIKCPECRLHRRKHHCRNLAKLSEKVKSFFFGNILYDKKSVKYPPKHEIYNVFERDVKNYSKKLRLFPKVYLTSRGSLIFQNKQKAAVEYFYYNIQQKEKYNNLVKALSQAFQAATMANGISDEDQMKIFSSCYPSIRSWNLLIKNHKKKWIQILTDKLIIYNLEKKEQIIKRTKIHCRDCKFSHPRGCENIDSVCNSNGENTVAEEYPNTLSNIEAQPFQNITKVANRVKEFLLDIIRCNDEAMVYRPESVKNDSYAATNEGKDNKHQLKIFDVCYPLILEHSKVNETEWRKRFRKLLSGRRICLLEFEYFLSNWNNFWDSLIEDNIEKVD
ncbi:hypothetical protein C922_02528 [Plasmodium inui San Antonio 1]|uniref:Plasmodium RESA N-terminal domain-containing protein n=1 Tax=Plasmodium inui San Antonio 1 TaxID=1237626 RepID=W7ACU1_9APIC|nr:hypothetical protein C922_02528 [Plasmodium inui San Antonio 1]EUD66944.1 hypothetical protein C922_02528 [Plasmodium inui San Antonio 1]